MCGIFGFVGNLKHFSADKLKVLALYNMDRGEDSTGYVYIKDHEFSMNKKIINARKFIEDSDNKFPNSEVIIGHTRKKTIGANTLSNAHPFVNSTIAGVHNGTLTNYKEMHEYFLNKLAESIEIETDQKDKIRLEKDFDDLKACNFQRDSDSYILYKLFNIFTPEQVLSKYAGAAAIVMSDQYGNVTIYRDDTRTLFMGRFDKNPNHIYFSSMEDSLKAIGCPDKQIFHFAPEKIYSIFDGEILDITNIKRDPIPEKKPIPPVTTKKLTEGNEEILPRITTVDEEENAIRVDTDVERRITIAIGDENVGITFSKSIVKEKKLTQNNSLLITYTNGLISHIIDKNSKPVEYKFMKSHHIGFILKKYEDNGFDQIEIEKKSFEKSFVPSFIRQKTFLNTKSVEHTTKIIKLSDVNITNNRCGPVNCSPYKEDSIKEGDAVVLKLQNKFIPVEILKIRKDRVYSMHALENTRIITTVNNIITIDAYYDEITEIIKSYFIEDDKLSEDTLLFFHEIMLNSSNIDNLLSLRDKIETLTIKNVIDQKTELMKMIDTFISLTVLDQRKGYEVVKKEITELLII